VVLLLIADASCLMAIQKIFFRDRTGREVTVERVLGVYPMPSPPTRMSGGNVISSHGGDLGRAPAANDFWTFCAILHVYAITIPNRTSLEG